MSKAMYLGVDGVARKVSKPYVGVDGVARKCKTGYVGVDGTARQFLSGASKVTVTVTVSGKNAGSGITVYGITDEAGNAVKTNSSGVAVGVTEAASVTVSTKEGYTDAADVSETVAVNGDTAVTLALTSKSGSLDVLSNKTVKLSAAVTAVKVLAVGGGGSGAVAILSFNGENAYGGTGGAVVSKTVSRPVGQNVVCTIGNGGSGKSGYVAKNSTSEVFTNGSAGGTTTVVIGGTTVSANGGKGGFTTKSQTADTYPGDGADGTAITEFSSLKFGAEGGAGTCYEGEDGGYDMYARNGGSYGGGNAAAVEGTNYSSIYANAGNAIANTGSGGGGAVISPLWRQSKTANSGAGGSGRVMLKW